VKIVHQRSSGELFTPTRQRHRTYYDNTGPSADHQSVGSLGRAL